MPNNNNNDKSVDSNNNFNQTLNTFRLKQNIKVL